MTQVELVKQLLRARTLLALAAPGAIPIVARLVQAGGYVTACMISIGTIALALALGLLLPGPGEALGVSMALVVIANILDGQASLHALDVALPMYYWQRWTPLLDGTSRRDPAA